MSLLFLQGYVILLSYLQSILLIFRRRFQCEGGAL